MRILIGFVFVAAWAAAEPVSDASSRALVIHAARPEGG